jgi:hypothetical protein
MRPKGYGAISASVMVGTSGICRSLASSITETTRNSPERI